MLLFLSRLLFKNSNSRYQKYERYIVIILTSSRLKLKKDTQDSNQNFEFH